MVHKDPYENSNSVSKSVLPVHESTGSDFQPNVLTSTTVKIQVNLISSL